jgi:methylglyoxal reductase
MKYRTLGETDIEVSAVVFGAWAIGGWSWGGTDDAQAELAIRAALDRGVNAVDTAPMYGFGHSEHVVGRAIAGRRDGVVVMTKVGLRWDDERGEPFFSTQGPSGPVMVRRNARPDSIRTEVERSLVRLGVDVIDLVQIHWPDSTTPVADSIGALLALKEEGKLRAIGVSNFRPEMMAEARRALGEVPLASDQAQYSLVARDLERDVLPWADERGIGVLVYSPLEQGLLTGCVGPEREFPEGDARRRRATFSPANRARVNAALEGVVRPVAEAHGATVAQTVIAWTVAQPGVTAAIVGVRAPGQAGENAAAGDLVLEGDELARIRAAFEPLQLEPAAPPTLVARARRALGRFLDR